MATKPIRLAAVLCFVVFLAFGFQVIGVFSEPVSQGKLPIASVGNFDYGVLGYCQKDKDCSSAGIGYVLQDDTTNSWNQSSQKTLSEIFVVHIVAAGLLLITFFMTIGTLWENSRYWTVVEVMLGLCFVASALSFAVEVALFKTDLKFAGWFTLASTVLLIIANIIIVVMQKRLHSTLGKTTFDEKDNFFTNEPLTFRNGGDFVVGRDDEKLLKQPIVTTQPVSHTNRSFQPPKPPSLMAHNPSRGYEKIPDAQQPVQRPLPSKGPVGSGTQRSHALPSLPIGANTGSSDSVGAVSRQNQQNQYGNQRQPIEPTRGANANQQQQQEKQQQQQQQQRPLRSSNASIASTQAATIPAGAYIKGVDQTGRYGPNVVQIPKFRNAPLPPAESATIEYHKDETQTKSPISRSKVPNYSRLSAQEGSPTLKSSSSPNDKSRGNVNPMLERYVQSTKDTVSNNAPEPFYDAPISRIPTQSPDSEASHYTSVSERQPDNPPVGAAPASQQQNGQLSHPAQARAAQQQPQQHQQQPQYYANNAMPSQQQAYQPQGQAMNYQNAYAYQNYGYQQPQQPQYQMAAYNGNYAPQPYYQMGYAPGYSGPASGYPPAYGMGYGSPQAKAPRPRQPPQQQQRSAIALETNPDFSIGDFGKKRRPNRR